MYRFRVLRLSSASEIFIRIIEKYIRNSNDITSQKLENKPMKDIENFDDFDLNDPIIDNRLNLDKISNI